MGGGFSIMGQEEHKRHEIAGQLSDHVREQVFPGVKAKKKGCVLAYMNLIRDASRIPIIRCVSPSVDEI